MLYAFGVGEVPLSTSGDPARGDLAVHTIRAVGAVSRALVGSEPGSVIGVRGPYDALPVEEARDETS
jgi:NAD(P)H-flavin reductase